MEARAGQCEIPKTVPFLVRKGRERNKGEQTNRAVAQLMQLSSSRNMVTSRKQGQPSRESPCQVGKSPTSKMGYLKKKIPCLPNDLLRKWGIHRHQRQTDQQQTVVTFTSFTNEGSITYLCWNPFESSFIFFEK